MTSLHTRPAAFFCTPREQAGPAFQFRIPRRLVIVAIATLAVLVALTGCATQTAVGQQPPQGGIIDTQNPQNVSAAIQILLFVTVLSLAPAIQHSWPVMLLVELTGMLASPNTACSALASLASPAGVEVAWALIYPISEG